MALIDIAKPITDLIGKVIDRVIPDPVQAAEMKLKVATLEQNGELAQLTAETNLALGQIDVNKAEATNTSIFVSGWRPYVGWVCGSALAYAAIIEPIARFIAQVIFHYFGAFPIVNTEITLQVLLGLLGLGAMRSYDKRKGVA
jgi:hypothetical protein